MAIPRTEPELVLWYTNFAANLTSHAEALGLPTEAVSQATRDAEMLRFLVGHLIPVYQGAVQTRTAYKNIVKDGPLGTPLPAWPPQPVVVETQPASVPPGIMPRLRQLVARIKASPAYNETIGRNLGISGDESAAPAGPPKPTAKASAQAGGEVKIEFSKVGFDGVLIEGRRGSETAWGRLGTDNYSPYLDTRPPLEAGRPEVREYRLRFIERDEPVGEWSDIITVTTTP